MKTITTLKPATVSTLFSAAVDLINGEPDHLARICKLADAYPQVSREVILQTLKEAAVHLQVYTETIAQRAEALKEGPK